MLVDWKTYQEDVARFFRELGLNASTDVTIDGVRTRHAIDVFVVGNFKGVTIKWAVECKFWQRHIPKLNVLAFRTIVDDVGADRGFMMSETGYQSGAREAAYLSNVHLSSLQDLRETCGHELGLMRLRKLFSRARKCHERYWKLDKYVRIEHGLRPDVGGPGYSGTRVIEGAEDAIISAMFDGFPLSYSEQKMGMLGVGRSSGVDFPDTRTVQTPNELADLVQERLDELDRLLTQGENASPVKRA